MYEFIKVEGLDEWHLRVTSDSNIDEIQEAMIKRLARVTVEDAHAVKEDPNTFINVTLRKALFNLDYKKAALEIGPVAVNKRGTYFPIDNKEIIEKISADFFPIDEPIGEIVVCENDKNAHSYWKDYLKKRFPDKKITILSFFDTLCDEEIKYYFSKAEYITFSTTFTTDVWIKKLLKNRKEKYKIIGHCYDQEKVEEIFKVFNMNGIEMVSLN